MNTRMTLARIEPFPIAKLMGIAYALIGLLIGALFSLFGLVGLLAGLSQFHGGPEALGALFPLIFGIGAIIFMPIFYGLLGFICTLIAAVIYNWLAGRFGGAQVLMTVQPVQTS